MFGLGTSYKKRLVGTTNVPFSWRWNPTRWLFSLVYWDGRIMILRFSWRGCAKISRIPRCIRTASCMSFTVGSRVGPGRICNLTRDPDDFRSPKKSVDRFDMAGNAGSPRPNSRCDPSPLHLPLTAFDWYNSAFLCSFLFFCGLGSVPNDYLKSGKKGEIPNPTSIQKKNQMTLN